MPSTRIGAAMVILTACAPAAPAPTSPAEPLPVAIVPKTSGPEPPEPPPLRPEPSAPANEGPPLICRQDRAPGTVKDPPPRKPKIKVGPQPTNCVRPELVQRPVRERFQCFRRCYQAGLARDPTLSGRVSVRFVIEEDTGVVRDVKDGGSDLSDNAVVACVMEEFKELRFPAPSGDVTVSYPIVFTP
jgi:hypothetical protein